MKRTLFLLPLVLSNLICSAQIGFVHTYDKSCYDYGHAIVQNRDGGFMLAGRSGDCNQTQYTLFIRTDEFGDTLWIKKYDHLGWTDCMATSNDGTYMLGGFNGNQMQMAKLDEDGHEIWHQTYGAPTTAEYARAIVQSPDSGWFVFGDLRMTNPSLQDFKLYKLDKDGNVEWNRTYASSIFNDAESMILTSDQHLLLCGTYASQNSYPNTSRIHLIKTNLNGDVIWSTTYHDHGTYSGTDVIETTDGNYVVVGHRWLSPYDEEAYVMKVDTGGAVVWTTEFGGSRQEYLYAVTPTTDGGCVTVGIGYSEQSESVDMIASRLDAEGNVLWNRFYDHGQAEVAYDVQESQGNFVVLGATNNQTVPFGDVLFLTVDENGNFGEVSSTGETIDYSGPLLYPNPTDGGVMIDFGVVVDDLTANLYNMLGALLESKRVSSVDRFNQNLPLVKGVYVIQLVYPDGTSKNLKVVKE